MEAKVTEIIDLLGFSINLKKIKIERKDAKVSYDGYLHPLVKSNAEFEKLLTWLEEGTYWDDIKSPAMEFDLSGVIKKADDKEVAKFLKVSVQSLSNYKRKGQIPYKAINSACIFLNWSINSLLSGQQVPFLMDVWFNYKLNTFEENEKGYQWDNFKNIVNKIEKTFEYIRAEFLFDYPSLIELCIGESLSSSVRNTVNNKAIAAKIIFPNSQLYIKGNPSLEVLNHNDQKQLIENKKLSRKEIKQILDENRDDRGLDLFDVWMFAARIRNKLKYRLEALELDAIDPDPSYVRNIEHHMNHVKKYLSADYYVYPE